MWNLNNNTNKCICETETDATDIENKLTVTKGEGSEEGQIWSIGLTDTHYYM